MTPKWRSEKSTQISRCHTHWSIVARRLLTFIRICRYPLDTHPIVDECILLQDWWPAMERLFFKNSRLVVHLTTLWLSSDGSSDYNQMTIHLNGMRMHELVSECIAKRRSSSGTLQANLIKQTEVLKTMKPLTNSKLQLVWHFTINSVERTRMIKWRLLNEVTRFIWRGSSEWFKQKIAKSWKVDVHVFESLDANEVTSGTSHKVAPSKDRRAWNPIEATGQDFEFRQEIIKERDY